MTMSLSLLFFYLHILLILSLIFRAICDKIGDRNYKKLQRRRIKNKQDSALFLAEYRSVKAQGKDVLLKWIEENQRKAQEDMKK
jgi:hypothetical protein